MKHAQSGEIRNTLMPFTFNSKNVKIQIYVFKSNILLLRRLVGECMTPLKQQKILLRFGDNGGK